MSSIRMIITEVISTQTAQMGLVEHDHMVQQISSSTPNPPFSHPVLPGTLILSADRLHAHGFDRVDDAGRELRITIQDQVTVCALVRKGLSQLLHYPLAGGVLRHVEVQDSSRAMTDDEETVENSESHRRRGEEVPCGDYLSMIPEKTQPALGRVSP